MSEMVDVHLRVPEDDWENFVTFVVEAHGQKYGNLGREAGNAFAEYADQDRLERVDEKVDEILARLDDLDATHTHKHSETAEKAERIAEVLANTDRVVIPDEQVVRAIEDVAGGDDRTLRKYKDVLKRRGLAFQHPSDEWSWTLDREEWLGWAVDHINTNPSVSRTDVIQGYPIGYDEIEEMATEVVQ